MTTTPPAADSVQAARLLSELGVALVEAGDLGELLQRLADAAREIAGARYSAIGVLNDEGTGLSQFITSGMDEAAVRGIGDLPRGRGLLGTIITERRAVRVDDIPADPRSAGFPAGHPPMTSFLGLPIVLADRVFGNIYVTDAESGAFTDAHERLLETLAAYAALAVRGVQIRDERQRWIDDLEEMCSITGAVGRMLDTAELLPEAARRSRALLRCDTVGVGLLDDAGALHFPYAHGAHALHLEALRLSGGGLGAARSALREAIPDATSIVEPLAVQGRTVGALVVVGHRDDDGWQGRIIEVLAQHIGVAVANASAMSEQEARLEEQSEQRLREVRELMEQEVRSRTLAAQEDERSRVARELHDEAGQLLTGIGLRLKALEAGAEPEAAAELSELRRHVRDAQGSMRQILRRLRPVDLEAGLRHAIVELSGRIEETGQCVVGVQISDLPPMSDEVELVLFRATQEALTNVARHSEASRAGVALTAFGERLRLTVEDDGVGFDPSAATDRFGLGGVAERVALVGGSLRLQSAPGAGTSVTVDVEACGPVGTQGVPPGPSTEGHG